MDIKDYIRENEKQYHLRIKTVVPVDDAAMDRIEYAIQKFLPLEVSRPTKTILQKHPLDFKNIEAAEVWIVDVKFGLPASPFVVREEIRKALKAPETFVVVRARNEAIEVETKRLNAVADIEAEAKKRGLVPAALLSDDPDYVEAAEDDLTYAGDKYNSAFLAVLGQIEDERKEQREKADSQLFGWMKPVRDTVADPNAFNAHIADAPKVKPSKAGQVKIPNVKMLGDQNSDDLVVKRVYTDKNGKKVVLSRTYGKDN